MVYEATVKEKLEIYELLRKSYPIHSRSYFDFYFKYLFDKGKCLYVKQDKKIVSTLQFHEHVLKFSRRRLLCAYICNDATAYEYRRKGLMRYLMTSVLDEMSHNYLITFINSFDPKLYESYGFEVITYRKQYEISFDYLKHMRISGISKNASNLELYQLYQAFSEHFDGCYERSIHYYEMMRLKEQMENFHICVYRNRNHQVAGYAFYVITKKCIQIKEIVYLESVALLKMLRCLCDGFSHVCVEVSEKEQLERLFPMSIAKRRAAVMARVNQYQLFNKLFNCQVQTPKEAYQILRRPIFMNEEH